MPKHSILIASYNRFDYLFETVTSCLSSTDGDFEILITDDCSDDAQADLYFQKLSSLDPRIKILRNDINKGVGFRFNQLHLCARGKYVHMLGSDDLLHPLRLVRVEECLSNNKNLVYASNANMLTYDYKLTSRSHFNYSSSHIQAALFFCPVLLHPSVSHFNIKLSDFNNYTIALRSAVDYMFYVQNFAHFSYFFDTRPSVYLVHSKNAITRTSSTRKNQLINHEKCMHYLWSQYIPCSIDDMALLRCLYVTSEFSTLSLSHIERQKYFARAINLFRQLKSAILQAHPDLSLSTSAFVPPIIQKLDELISQALLHI